MLTTEQLQSLLSKWPTDLAMPKGLMASSVLAESANNVPEPEGDPYALAMLKHYRSLMAMPIFCNLRSALPHLRALF